MGNDYQRKRDAATRLKKPVGPPRTKDHQNQPIFKPKESHNVRFLRESQFEPTVAPKRVRYGRANPVPHTIPHNFSHLQARNPIVFRYFLNNPAKKPGMLHSGIHVYGLTCMPEFRNVKSAKWQKKSPLESGLHRSSEEETISNAC
jgi:hypothetical protein